MADEGKVVIELIGKDNATQTFVKSMKDMASSVQNLEASGKGLGSLGGMFDSLKGHWLGLVSSIGGGLSIGKLVSDFEKWAATESALLKMAKRLNDTVENVSALGYVAKKTGMDADAFNIALERMQKNVSNAAKGVEQATGMVDEFGEPVGKAGKALDELGLRAEVLNKLSLPQKLKEIASAMRDNVDPADQGRVALELFGKSGGGLVIALKEGPEAIQKWIDRYQQLGGVLTTEGAEAMSKAKAAAGDLSIAWNNFSRELYEGVAPAITFAISRLNDLVVAARNAGNARKEFDKNAMANPLHEGDWWVPALISGGGGGGGGWGEDLRKPPTRQGPQKAGGGGKGGGADELAKEIEKIKREVDQARKTAEDGIDEAWRFSWDLQQKSVQAVAARIGLERDSREKLSSIWDSVMSDEKLSYQERLTASQEYKVAHIKVVDDEISAIKEKYGSLVSGDALAAYRSAQIDKMGKQISTTMDPTAFSWESAWKRAAENVQDALGNTIFSLLTQTKSAGDIITNLTNGVLQIMSQMAAQSIMSVAKMAMQMGVQGLFPGGGGGYGGTGFSSSFWDQMYSGGGYAHGEVFQRFARGDIFHSPRVFPMAQGYGVMAEAGPEAVMPLTRIGGDLGVKAVGASPAVNVIIYPAPNTQARSETQPNGDVIVMFDELGAQAFNRGGKLYKAITRGSGATKR